MRFVPLNPPPLQHMPEAAKYHGLIPLELEIILFSKGQLYALVAGRGLLSHLLAGGQGFRQLPRCLRGGPELGCCAGIVHFEEGDGLL